MPELPDLSDGYEPFWQIYKAIDGFRFAN